MSENLANILQDKKQFILEMWERSVRDKVSPARKESQIAIIDSVPFFLDELILALRTNLNMVKSDILRFCHKHGSERFHTTDYSIEDALCEYNLLRKVIIHTLEEETELSIHDRDIILDAINYGMVKAGSEYAKHQMMTIKSERSMLASIIEQLPAAVWIAEAPTGEIMLSNSLGKSDEFFEAFHQSGHILARAIVNECPCKNEIIKIRRIDSADEFIRLDAAPIVNSFKEITHGVAIGTNVTELYSTQEELRVLFEMAGTGKVVINHRTKQITRVNKAFTSMIKYQASELLKLKISDLTYDKDDENQTKFKCKDGSEFWGATFMSPILRTPAGEEQCICTIIDITERKKAEEYMKDFNQRLQMITDIQPTLIGQVDKDFRYVFVNQTFLEWYQVEKEDVIGKKISENLGSEYEKIEPYLYEAMKGRRVVFETEINFKKGTKRFLHITYSPNFDKNQNVVGLFISVTDHTELRKTLNEFRKLANEQTQVVDSLHVEQKMRDKFISALSHDLRTPLTTATIAAQMIERKSEDPKILNLAQRTSASLIRVAKMIEDLLDANSFQAGHKFVPELQHMNVVELAQNTLNELETIYGERFILDSVDEIETFLSPSGVRRVIENLCSNAIKYGSPTAPVTVGLYQQGDELCLTVHNYGVPLKAEDTKKLFDQFVRSSSATKSGKTGWGIGLSVVKAVVEAHGGTVDIESDEDGTKFKILLPLDARSFVNNAGDEPQPLAH